VIAASHDVLGIGNAIVDVLAHADDAFLARRGLPKGAMTLVTAGQADLLYREMGRGVECSGGSAANTMVGLASLGGAAAFVGKVRDDALGVVFGDDIRRAGVAFATPAATDGPPTGRCLIFVTPDAQRTMQTFLGAAGTLSSDDLPEGELQAARIVYLEGYLWDLPPAKAAFLRAAEIAHAAGRKVALSLSDSFCVERHRTELRDFASRHVDVLFANETEIVALCGAGGLDDAVREVREMRLVAALTLGAKGSLVVSDGATIEVPAAPAPRVVDTTGAGDLYASGFLFGLTHGRDLASCARLGGIAAAEIIGHFGARPETALAELARAL